jgi:hypothetical protein
MASRLGERLRAARRRWFVGREAERDLFRAALRAEDLPFCVLYIYGPGGVGKTTLLAELARIAEETGAAAHSLDARNVEAMPDAFVAALRAALGLEPAQHPLDALAGRPGRHVLLVDTYETLAPLDAWLRDVFLPQLPENVLIVLAGRRPLGAGWRADPGWQTVLRQVPLRNLSPAESRQYLAQQDIPAGQHGAVLGFTHGHPLALSLVAELVAQRGDARFEPEAAPDVVKALIDRFVENVPEPAYRLALEACAVVRVVSEPLLAAMLGVAGGVSGEIASLTAGASAPAAAVPDVSAADAQATFDWLRGLTFVESGPFGLFPHDLAREALIADLRWRSPERYALLHDRARTVYLTRLQAARDGEQQAVLADYVFLHRDNPLVRPFLEWEESGNLLTDAMREADVPPILEMVQAHEGEASARLAAHWLERQPRGVFVFRDADQQPAGFMAMVALESAGVEDIAVDPAAVAVTRFLDVQAPLRPGERALLFRFWMGRDTYQAVSSAQSLAFLNAVRLYLSTPGLAVHFFACAEPAFWEPVFAYADLARVPEADFEVGGRRYGMYWHDWRVVPPMAWLQLLAEREIATSAAAPPPAPSAPLVVLSQEAFTAAVRDALRDFHRPDALRRNPLLRSRLVTARAGVDTDDQKLAALRALVQQTIAAFEHAPRDAKLYRALDRTYLRPAPTQERAAELLDLPWSTYRRHLSAGVGRVVDALWRQETHGAEG